MSGDLHRPVLGLMCGKRRWLRVFRGVSCSTSVVVDGCLLMFMPEIVTDQQSLTVTSLIALWTTVLKPFFGARSDNIW